QYNNQNNFV
nr:Chain A, Major prion protein [Myodes glareolus]6BTK_A Chain A, Major prion protein [Myodes glareolus]